MLLCANIAWLLEQHTEPCDRE